MKIELFKNKVPSIEGFVYTYAKPHKEATEFTKMDAYLGENDYFGIVDMHYTKMVETPSMRYNVNEVLHGNEVPLFTAFDAGAEHTVALEVIE